MTANLFSNEPSKGDFNYLPVTKRFLDSFYPKKHKPIDTNLVEVHIYLETNNIMTIEEQPNYGLLQLMNDLGGVIGLYLGLAVVSIFEICELLCILGYIAVKRMLGVVNEYEVEEMVNLRQSHFISFRRFPNTEFNHTSRFAIKNGAK